MKLNDIVTWTGRNGEKRFGLIVASDGNKYRVMRWCQWARRPRYYWIRGERMGSTSACDGDTKSLLVGVDEKRGEDDE